MIRTRETMLKEIMQNGFVLDDLALFLDTHPTSTEAICEYNKMSEKYRMAVENFEAQYGPLQKKETDKKEWVWIKGPWPWELNCGCKEEEANV